MATNKKKIFITESMSQLGRALLNARDDIETIEFPNLISASDFEALLVQHAPVHGVALGATRFGEPELEAAKDMKVVTRIGLGYDAVEVRALGRRKIPLLVAGVANSPSVAEQALFMMLTLAKRAVEMHALVKDGKWSTRLGKLPYDLYGKTVLIVGFGRIGTRTAKRCLAMELNVLVHDPYKSAAEIKAPGWAQAGLARVEREPAPAGHSLFELPNVIMAPHVAGVTREAVDRMSEQTARNILSALDGETIRQNVLNKNG